VSPLSHAQMPTNQAPDALIHPVPHKESPNLPKTPPGLEALAARDPKISKTKTRNLKNYHQIINLLRFQPAQSQQNKFSTSPNSQSKQVAHLNSDPEAQFKVLPGVNEIPESL
jgi:hypothetical protein